MTFRSGTRRSAWSAAALAVVAAALAPYTLSAQRETSLQTAPARVLAARRQAPITQAVFDAAATSRSGRVRVIVGLRVPYAMEASLSDADRGQQRLDIAAAQAGIERTLALFAPADVKRFTVVPGLAAEVDGAALGLLAADPRVDYVELDAIERASLLQSTAIVGSTIANSSGYTGTNQTIAILDTGVDAGHPFLAGRVVGEGCFSSIGPGFSPVCLSPNGPGSAAPCAVAGCDHGTHVAGIAAGRGEAFSGVAPAAAIMAVQVFTRFDDPSFCGSTEPCIATFVSDQIRGLEHVYSLRQQFNIAAANMSLGGGAYTSYCDAQQASRKTIIDQLRGARIATIVASGNNGYADALSAPACISTAVSVGSTEDGSFGAGPLDSVSWFSNVASFLTLLAPGSAITSSVPGGGFATFGGTSMAAPHVSGSFAVFRSRFPQATPNEVVSVLTATGAPVPVELVGFTVAKPRINIAAAVGVLASGPGCTYAVTPTSTTAGPSGALVLVTVNTQPGCPWQASTQSPFIRLPPEQPRGGVGTITFHVLQNVIAAVRTGTVTIAGQSIAVTQGPALALDSDGDDHLDLLWHHRGDGRLSIWLMDGLTLREGVALDQVADTNWQPVGVGDLDRNGRPEIIWQHRGDGRVAVWFMNAFVRQYADTIGQVADLQWRIRAVGDMDGDGNADLVWQHEGSGALAVWRMNGTTVLEGKALTPDRVADTDWEIVGAADFDRNGTRDLVWRHRVDGRNAVWLMNGDSQLSGVALPSLPDLAWQLRGVADVNGDWQPDLIWQHTGDGRIGVWLMNGTTMVSGELLTAPAVPDTNWAIVGPR